MSEKHTQGKLIVRGYSIYAEDRTPVADTCLTSSTPDNDHANAVRIAACWNYCNGLDTDDMVFAVAAGGSVAAAFDAELKKNRKLAGQRDELLAHLEELTDMAEDAWGEDRPAVKIARAAIAEMKGPAA